MKSRFHEAADAELTEAVAYYDDKAAGLGDRFLAEVKAATRSIERYPEIAPIIEDGVRANCSCSSRTASYTLSKSMSSTSSLLHTKVSVQSTGQIVCRWAANAY